MNTNKQPTKAQILKMMKDAMANKLPNSIELASNIMPEMVFEQAKNSAFAMPKENGALPNETRTLIYLAVALATGSKQCIKAMTNKAKTQNISTEKLLETFKIARYAEATRVLGNAKILFKNL